AGARDDNMRCGTRVVLQATLQALGLSGRLNTAFVERVKEDAAAERGCFGAADLGDTPGCAATAAAAGVVAGRPITSCAPRGRSGGPSHARGTVVEGVGGNAIGGRSRPWPPG